MDGIVAGGVYKARCGLEAVVWWKVLDEKSDQWFVRDSRGCDWAVNSLGRLWFGRAEADHPLDLIEDTGRTDGDQRSHQGFKWRLAPEAKPKKKRQ